nr:sugar diacid recognition domain-containing protein [Lentibacillus persicus]
MHVAQNVVKAVSKILPFHISLSDEEGYIIGSSIPERIGKLHAPSKEVLEKDSYLIFNEEKVKNLPNVLPGVAVPINFDSSTVGVLGIIGPPEQVEPYAQLISKYIEMRWQEMVDEQLEELNNKTLETFAQYILLNNKTDHLRVEQYCKMLNISSATKRFCIVVDIGDSLINTVQNKTPIEQLKKRLAGCTQKAFNSNQNVICTFLNTEKLVLLKPVQSEDDYMAALEQFETQSQHLTDMFKTYQVNHIFIAAGNMRDTINQMNESYHEAESLIKFGRQHNISPQVYSLHNWDVLKEMLPYQINNHFREKIMFRIHSLFDDDDFPELMRNFLVYCDNQMNISQSAKELYIHRNTLNYRLKKIERITSVNIKDFEQCIILYLVLKKYDKSFSLN